MYQIFRESGSGNGMDADGLVRVVQSYSNGAMPEDDVRAVYNQVNKQAFTKGMTFAQFEEAFSIRVPTYGSIASETAVIQKVREWMFQKQHATEGAFERLLRSCDRFMEKSMGRLDFHKALFRSQMGLSAPEIHFLFDTLIG